jgi:Sec-independent protein translocase protein TatA
LDLFEILLILVLALIVLGPERLPEVLKVAGKVLRELRLASNTVLRELTEAIDEEPPVTKPLPPPPAAAPPRQEPPSPPSEQT